MGKREIRPMAVPLQEKQRFGDDRFAGEYKRRRFLALLDRPGMAMIVPHEKSNQGARIDDPLRHRP